MITGLFLDIEETIVGSSDTCILLPEKVEGIKRFIAKSKPDFIETFSWGLWTEQEKRLWERTSALLRSDWDLDIQTQTFDIEQQQLAFLRAKIGKVDPSEVIDFCGLLKKDTVFEWFIQERFKEGHFVLIDDMVPNKQINFENKLIITFFNVSEVTI